jgi:putative addiction module CopG family antidote
MFDRRERGSILQKQAAVLMSQSQGCGQPRTDLRSSASRRRWSPTMNNSAMDLSDDLKRFIAQEIALGRFRSRSEVIEAGLLLLAERETRLAELRSLIAESETRRSK